MIHRANTETKTLFHGVESSRGGYTDQSMMDDDVSEAALTDRHMLTQVEQDEADEKKGEGLDKDVQKLKERIASRLEVQ